MGLLPALCAGLRAQGHPTKVGRLRSVLYVHCLCPRGRAYPQVVQSEGGGGGGWGGRGAHGLVSSTVVLGVPGTNPQKLGAARGPLLALCAGVRAQRAPH